MERVKAKASIRARRDTYMGTMSLKVRGFVTSGENAERPFKAALKMKLRDAREFGGPIDISDEFQLGAK